MKKTENLRDVLSYYREIGVIGRGVYTGVTFSEPITNNNSNNEKDISKKEKEENKQRSQLDLRTLIYLNNMSNTIQQTQSAVAVAIPQVLPQSNRERPSGAGQETTNSKTASLLPPDMSRQAQQQPRDLLRLKKSLQQALSQRSEGSEVETDLPSQSSILTGQTNSTLQIAAQQPGQQHLSQQSMPTADQNGGAEASKRVSSKRSRNKQPETDNNNNAISMAQPLPSAQEALLASSPEVPVPKVSKRTSRKDAGSSARVAVENLQPPVTIPVYQTVQVQPRQTYVPQPQAPQQRNWGGSWKKEEAPSAYPDGDARNYNFINQAFRNGIQKISSIPFDTHYLADPGTGCSDLRLRVTGFKVVLEKEQVTVGAPGEPPKVSYQMYGGGSIGVTKAQTAYQTKKAWGSSKSYGGTTEAKFGGMWLSDEVNVEKIQDPLQSECLAEAFHYPKVDISEEDQSVEIHPTRPAKRLSKRNMAKIE